ncbi:single-stranded DNA-binding protein [Sporosarcina sp. NCCP-2222]|uniref:single-stranded DNA-binding protein n=1 Tax=Sporosarcina TaxID=1569 RepID=UPI001EDD735E|nr:MULTISPECIES: single-stranded DNA-binding protein [Sporosarcina]MCG3087355.1 single-stranded DNA-binding protein [Sporosarcina cyprini]GKV57703.1 single-stranded DNA-binding protein [Sporosarcina sp. NCCP-2222]
MINRVVLVGRLTKDPELKYTQSGIAVTRFTLAVNRAFSNQSGEREADFINCVTWRKQAENTANFLRKGSLAGVEGRIQTSSFDGQDGKRVFMTEVVADSVQFLEPRSASADRSGAAYGAPQNDQPYYQNQQPNQQYQQSNQQNYTRTNDDPFSTGGGPIEVSDDDLPF